MISEFLVPRRIEPLHEAVAQPHAGEDTASSNNLQQDAAADSDVQRHSPTKVEDYTISVEQVREHFRGKGLSKSKDTVQRWCRTGELDCQKRGVLSRYFTTEASLSALEQKLLPDMIAEQTGQVKVQVPTMQPDAAASETAQNGLPVHTPADEPSRSGMQVDEGENAAASNNIPVQPLEMQQHTSAELAKLQAENTGLREQLAEAKENNSFLREEIVSARGQRGDVVKIAEQMLGTLEAIAVGGRLERPKRQGSQPDQTADPVRYEPRNPAVHDV